MQTEKKAEEKPAPPPQPFIVPMLYMHSAHGDVPAMGDLNYVWGLYKYKDGAGRVRNIEGRCLIDFWWNFCGGMRFYSPQVNVYDRRPAGADAWHQEGGWFADGYFWHDPRDRKMKLVNNCTKAMDEAVPDLCALSGVESMRQDQAYAIMERSLAAGVLATAAHYNKRWLVGADRVGGHLKSLVDKMMGLNGHGIWRSPIIPNTSMLGRPAPSDAQDSWRQGMPTYVRPTMKASYEVTWNGKTNWNSGSSCVVPVVMGNNRNGPNNKEVDKALNDCCASVQRSIADVSYLWLAPVERWSN